MQFLIHSSMVTSVIHDSELPIPILRFLKTANVRRWVLELTNSPGQREFGSDVRVKELFFLFLREGYNSDFS